MNYKLACVTGASAGIGEATALALASVGTNLILLARRKDRLQKLKEKITSKYSVNVEIFVVDVSQKSSVDLFVSSHQKRLEKVDLLINNAGLAKGREPLQLGNTEDWDVMIDTNIKGLLYLTRAIVPHMIQNKHGHIVNIGSVAGRWTYPAGSVYCATKFAVRAISEGLRMDLLGTQVRVTNIEPGMVETEFSLVRFKDADRAKAVYEGLTPLTAQDIAETIVWCVDRPSHVNIQEIVIFPTDQASVQNINRRV